MDPAALAAAWLQAVTRLELSPKMFSSGPQDTLTDVIAGELRHSAVTAELSQPQPSDPGHVVDRVA
ncbi:MAG: hypothetical protein ACLPKB_23530 [Xanthobacteraceae bacterium]